MYACTFKALFICLMDHARYNYYRSFSHIFIISIAVVISCLEEATHSEGICLSNHYVVIDLVYSLYPRPAPSILLI